MRKVIGLDPLNLNKKFVAVILAIFAVLVIIGLFAGCGDDNSVNNGNGNTNEILFSLDSLAIITPPFTKDTVFVISNANTIKIAFTGETNADSINGSALFKVSSIDNVNNNIIFDTTYNATLHMNNNFEFFINTANNPCSVVLYIQCLRTPPYVFFMRLKNIKVYKIN